MNQEQISKYVDKLRQIAYHKKLSNFEGLSAKDYNYKWLLNNDSSFICDKSIPVDIVDDAIEIIHLFSEEPKDLIRIQLESQTFDKEVQMYLHFTKDIKLPM